MLPESCWVTDSNDFSVDACDTGLGGLYFGCYYHIVLPPNFVSHHIITKELLAILLACILWKDKLTRKHLIINSDNETEVFELKRGSFKSKFRRQILREIWYLSALHHFVIKAKHVPREINRVSDCLSQCTLLRQQRLDTAIPSAQLSGCSDSMWKNFRSVLNQYLRFCS